MNTSLWTALVLLIGTLLTVEAAPADRATGFEGLWETSYGRMRLQSDGETVRGTYSSVPNSEIEGRLRGDTLEFSYREPSVSGEGRFELSDDRQSFEGRWRAEGSREWTPWNGKRVVPEPGRRWLVILEARWEEGLHEPEYAFGEMLRSYFTMAPEVQVRERRFHDEADFRRFAREVGFLAEPAVVLVSTHGSPKGLSVGGRSIGPEAIADSLRHASNVELLHLAGCDILRGEAAETIRGALPEDRRFPISGYTTKVDWAASALSDFTYLTFVLMHGMPPASAIEQTHIAAPYSGDVAVPDCAFVPLGLVLLPARGERVGD